MLSKLRQLNNTQNIEKSGKFGIIKSIHEKKWIGNEKNHYRINSWFQGKIRRTPSLSTTEIKKEKKDFLEIVPEKICLPYIFLWGKGNLLRVFLKTSIYLKQIKEYIRHRGQTFCNQNIVSKIQFLKKIDQDRVFFVCALFEVWIAGVLPQFLWIRLYLYLSFLNFWYFVVDVLIWLFGDDGVDNGL